MKRTLIITALGSILIFLFFKFESRLVSHQKSDTLEIYRKFVSGEFQNANADVIVSVLGNPNTRNMVRDNEIWSYGPSLDDLKNRKVGDLIGINIYMDKSGKVVRCLGIHKDM